jgi:phospholipid/cholesterol/gamma-HCH transport system substrate-binding protein
MQKQAPTLGRLLVMVGFALSCFGLLLYLWLAFGGSIPLAPKGYRFETSFGEAAQLANEADVRISGVSVGKVKETEPTPDGRSRTIIELDHRYAPIPRDTKAILRQKTLLGETYVELTPGDPSSGMIPEDGVLPASQISPTVELDEIFQAFDAPTREAFQTWMQSQAMAVQGRGQDINDAFGNLAPFAVDTDQLLQILNAQQADVRRVINGTGDVFAALTARDDQLGQLMENANRLFETTAERDAQLQDFFRVLPTFEAESEQTVRRLTEFARETDPLVDQLRPAARELSPTLQELEALAPDLRAFFRDLDPLIDASREGLPAMEEFLEEFAPFLGTLDPALRQLNPLLSYLAEYDREIVAFFANIAAATNARGGVKGGKLLQYLRTLNPLNPEALAFYPHRLPSNRTNPYMLPGGYSRLAKGLQSYETRQCARGGRWPMMLDPGELAGAVGGMTNALTPYLPPELANLTQEQVIPVVEQLNQYVLDEYVDELFRFLFRDTLDPIAPPCVQQGDFTTRGGSSQYPHVTEAPNGHTAGARAVAGR